MASKAAEHHTGRQENYTLLQGFEWHTPAGGKHWQWLKNQLSQLHDLGISCIWLPPPTKGGSPESTGYDAYDLYDLGEFDQKGGVATRWGKKDDLVELINAGKEHGIIFIADAVLNHRSGADEKETFKVKEVDQNDRNKEISEPYDIEGWTSFQFPGRGDKYSKLKLNFNHFSAVDYDDKTQKSGIFKIQGDGKSWSESVDTEQGNQDYLMAADVDHSHPDVSKDLDAWGDWMIKEIGFRGFRFDAVRHISENFMSRFVKHVRESYNEPLFCVGEFFYETPGKLLNYLDKFGEGQFSLFDTCLHARFHQAGIKMRDYDLRQIFDDTLVKARPVDAVTFVGNHDTQKGQTCEAPINPAFRPIAYALILLRFDGYPCVFAGDLWGIAGDDPEQAVTQLGDIIRARRDYAYGETRDYWDHPICIGWIRMGDDDHDPCAVVVSTGDDGNKRMEVGKEHAGETWTDLLGWHQGEVKIGDDGWADFLCSGQSLSIWTKSDARGRDQHAKKQ